MRKKLLSEKEIINGVNGICDTHLLCHVTCGCGVDQLRHQPGTHFRRAKNLSVKLGNNWSSFIKDLYKCLEKMDISEFFFIEMHLKILIHLY